MLRVMPHVLPPVLVLRRVTIGVGAVTLCALTLACADKAPPSMWPPPPPPALATPIGHEDDAIGQHHGPRERVIEPQEPATTGNAESEAPDEPQATGAEQEAAEPAAEPAAEKKAPAAAPAKGAKTRTPVPK